MNRFIQISLLTLGLLLSAGVAFVSWNVKKRSEADLPQLPALQGEKAIAQLQQAGLYASLGGALRAARYGIKWVERTSLPAQRGAYAAGNPAQQLQCYFTPEALHVGNAAQAWRTELKLRSLGYGARQLRVSAGRLNASGDRIEYVRSFSGAPAAATITEWYVNRAEGLEQGFTLSRPPSERRAGERLRVELTLSGDLRAQADSQGQAIELRRADGQPALRYEHLVVKDAGGRELPAVMGASAEQMWLEVDDTAAVYPVTIDPVFTQQAYLKASNTGAADRFGFTVAVAGDTAVVGAPLEDNSAVGVNGNPASDSSSSSGAVYVFVRGVSGWTQQAYLKASNTGISDFFGTAVAISGDTLVVGANGEDSNATGVNGNQTNNSAGDSGAVYIFVRSAGVWTQQAYLKASNTGVSDQFGNSVAIAGDTVVVGAWREDSNATGVNGNQSDNSVFEAGAAYVFVRSGTAWTQQAYLKASNPAFNSQFGFAVGIAGDTVVVGAPLEDSNATGVNGDPFNGFAQDAGAAYVFVRSGTMWSQQAYLKASNTETLDNFGTSVSVAGDTMVVGATGEDSSASGINGDESNNLASGSGAAYLFTRSGDSWSQGAYFKASNPAADDAFGVSVAVAGDTLLIGAHLEDSNATGVGGDQSNNSATDAGAAYVFARSDGSWSQQAYLKASNTGAGDLFGFVVALSGDTVVVGAYREDSQVIGGNSNQNDNSAGDAGAAYVFERSGATWSQQAFLKAANTGASDDFGFAVAISGDTVVIGAMREDSSTSGVNGDPSDNAAIDSGAAYIFVRSGATWSQQAYLKASAPDAFDNFGRTVAISGDTVVVGAGNEDSNATGVNGNAGDNSVAGSGAAYVFVRSGATWTQQAYLKASNTGSGDSFGSSVAISGDTIAVGANFEDSNATGSNGNQGDNSASNSGAAYVFVRSGATWTQQAYLKASNTGANDQFGFAMAIAGDTLAVSAPVEASNATGVNGNQSDNSAAVSGAAYVFVRSGTTWTQQAYLKASNTEASDSFGISIAVAGDTVVVGAPLEDSNATGSNGNQSNNSASNAGAAYVFARSAGTWMQQAYLKASNAEAGDSFGGSIAISNDTLIVGAGSEDSNATGSNGNQSDNSALSAGAAYVFERTGAGWSQQAYLKASNTEASDLFGVSVAVAGDTIVIGADREDSGDTGVNGNQSDNSAGGAGAAYVFVAPNLTVSKSAPVPALTVGQNSTYTITVTNISVHGGTAVSATVLDALPAGLELLSATGTNWTCLPTSGPSPIGTITCTFAGGTIAPAGGASHISLAVRPQPGTAGSSVTNRVSLDPDGGTNAPAPATCTALNTPSAGCGAPVGPHPITQPNTTPTITAINQTRQQGSPATNTQIATAMDVEDAETALVVTVNGMASAAVNGVTVSQLSVNAAGQVTANVVADCTATDAGFTLTVADLLGATANATLNVMVASNSQPNVGSYPDTVVVPGGGTMVTPTAAPTDNGTIASVTATATPNNFSGTFSGNTATGALTITNAGPMGGYSIAVTLTDNCGASVTRTFMLTVSSCGATLSKTGQSFAASGGAGSFTVMIDTGCSWTAVSNQPNFITVTAPMGTATTSGTVSFTVGSHNGANPRSGTITVAGQTFTVWQGKAFSDVPTSHPFYEFIGKLSARGITLGCQADNYCPDTAVTREQIAAFIIRALGQFNPPTPPAQRFADVPSSNPFYAFIEEMALRQITLGCGGGNYCPTSPVTREQMAAFIIRALHAPGYAPPTPSQQRFNDVPPPNPFYAHIEEMAARGITLGCQSNPPLYCPTSAVTRGQMAAFLVRAFNL